MKIGSHGRPAPSQPLGVAGAVQPPSSPLSLPHGVCHHAVPWLWARGHGRVGAAGEWRRRQIPAMGEDVAVEPQSCWVSHTPAAPICLSAWARPGNVRKINNKYLGNSVRAVAGGTGRQSTELGRG